MTSPSKQAVQTSLHPSAHVESCLKTPARIILVIRPGACRECAGRPGHALVAGLLRQPRVARAQAQKPVGKSTDGQTDDYLTTKWAGKRRAVRKCRLCSNVWKLKRLGYSKGGLKIEEICHVKSWQDEWLARRRFCARALGFVHAARVHANCSLLVHRKSDRTGGRGASSLSPRLQRSERASQPASSPSSGREAGWPPPPQRSTTGNDLGGGRTLAPAIQCSRKSGKDDSYP